VQAVKKGLDSFVHDVVKVARRHGKRLSTKELRELGADEGLVAMVLVADAKDRLDPLKSVAPKKATKQVRSRRTGRAHRRLARNRSRGGGKGFFRLGTLSSSSTKVRWHHGTPAARSNPHCLNRSTRPSVTQLLTQPRSSYRRAVRSALIVADSSRLHRSTNIAPGSASRSSGTPRTKIDGRGTISPKIGAAICTRHATAG
jgi:hypothetical protein